MTKMVNIYAKWSGTTGDCHLMKRTNGSFLRIVASGTGEYASETRAPLGYSMDELLAITENRKPNKTHHASDALSVPDKGTDNHDLMQEYLLLQR